MLTGMGKLMFGRTLTMATKRQSGTPKAFKRSMSASYGDKPKLITYNDLPVPSGDFYAAYRATQMKRNMFLLGSFAAFTATIGYIYVTGFFDYLKSPYSKYGASLEEEYKKK